MNRREFVAAALAGLPLLGANAGNRIGRSRISAISDEVANSPADALATLATLVACERAIASGELVAV